MQTHLGGVAMQAKLFCKGVFFVTRLRSTIFDVVGWIRRRGGLCKCV